MIKDRLALLRARMNERGIDALILPTSDFHDTEYVCEHFSARKHFSGFTGSAGTLVVEKDRAALWTDGRYFIQAARELEGSGIELMKMGNPGVPTITEYLLETLKPGHTLGFDGRCISRSAYEGYKKAMDSIGVKMETEYDLAGEAWPDRPALPATETFHYDEKYAGRSIEDKLADVRKEMKKAGAAHHITGKIDEIAWLFNLRAHDIPSFPVALSYARIDEDGGVLYIDDSRLDPVSRKLIEEAGISIAPYDAVYEDSKTLEGPVLLQKDLINSRIAGNVKDPLYGLDPIVLLKAVKNPVEVEGFYEAHRRDAAAVIQFWHWLEDQLAAGNTVTEISAADQLQKFRSMQDEYIEDSFTTISAYGANAAMAHYHPDAENPVVIEPHGLYLVDSGGHYLPGTTDITRTFVVGDLTDEEIRGFTLVLMGHINLAKAVFMEGCNGQNLDLFAREPLWKIGKDFNHGTGHGVGALLSVHEGPNGFRWKIVPERHDNGPLIPGMVTSDEPGLYEEGKFGIRHENLLVTVPAFESEAGRFLKHDVLTLVPFDVRGLDLSLMSDDQIEWLNDYHKRIYETIAPRLNESDAAFLYEKTRPVSRQA